MGGRRKGAGRPKGATSKTNEEVRKRAALTGELPLDYMLRVMRDPKTKVPRRDDMAKAAAPYLHSKLSAVTHSTDPKRPLRMIHEMKKPTVAEAAQAYQDMIKGS